MIGAIIALSIISFVLLCSTIMLLILYRSECGVAKFYETFSNRDDHRMEKFTNSIDDLVDVLEKYGKK